MIRNLKWVWRGEPTVVAAMVTTGEADIAWDVGVDNIKALPKDMIKSGSSAEIFMLHINTLWHPEMKNKNDLRQCAIGKAVNELLEAQGKDPSTAIPTLADMQAALDQGGSNCPTADLMENQLSSENLDFGSNSNNLP